MTWKFQLIQSQQLNGLITVLAGSTGSTEFLTFYCQFQVTICIFPITRLMALFIQIAFILLKNAFFFFSFFPENI